MARGLHASNVALALQLGLQHESVSIRSRIRSVCVAERHVKFYESLPPLRREIFRRLWWVIYISDRASNCAEKGSLLLEERRFKGLNLPACVWVFRSREPESMTLLTSATMNFYPTKV